MGEQQSDAVYRSKAAALRAAADEIPNNSLRYELLIVAEGYDWLAELHEKQKPLSPPR